MALQRVHGGRSGLVAVALIAAVTGCAVPDRPAILDLALPDSALSYLRPDSVRVEVLSPGVVYRFVWTARGPWAVHLVQAGLNQRCELEFRVLRAESREGGGVGHERVSSMVGRSSERVLAAVNADFFTPAGGTVGAEIVGGKVQTVAPRPTFAWKRGGDPWLGVAEARPGAVRVGWTVDLADGDGRTEAVGGFPDLIDHGRRVGNLEVVERPAFAAARHPRSAVGYDTRTSTFWMVVVDGRQMPYSAGMTLPELAGLFESLGADEALNLDGGGSSALVLRDATVNRPSDLTGERPVVNALALTWQSCLESS